MALTFTSLQDQVLDLIDADDPATREHVKNFINSSARDVWMAFPWRERRAEAIVTTVAPYSTGTVSTSGATVTGSGTTFPSTYTAGLFKFAPGYSSPWYYVTSRDSATQLTLARSFIETALSGSAYVVWQDTYNLASDVDTLVAVRLLKNGQDGPIAITTEDRLDEAAYHPATAAAPVVCAMVPQSSAGLPRIRLWPTPDAAYALSYRYLKAYTDMAAGSDLCVVPESRRDVLVCGALRWGFRLKNQYQKATAEDARFEGLLRQAWARERDVSPLPMRLRGFDTAARPIDRWNIQSIINP